MAYIDREGINAELILKREGQEDCSIWIEFIRGKQN